MKVTLALLSSLLLAFCLTLFPAAAARGESLAGSRPNIILVMTDAQGTVSYTHLTLPTILLV